MDITNLQLIAWIGFFCIGVASGIAAGVLVEKFRNKPPYVVAVVAVFFIAGVLLVAVSYPTIVLVEIPDLTGLSKDQAELRLEEEGLIFTSTEQYNDTVEIRRVISQDLSPRLLVRKGTEVHFIVSKGPKPTPTPPCIIDTMDSTSVWRTYKDDKGSSINIKSKLGRTDNAIEISYDLKEWGWVVISKKINPEILSEKEGIKFFYKGSGEPNTIELKLIYGDVGGTTFVVLWNRATVTDDWVSIEVPYSYFDCWWPDDECLRYGNKLDLTNVRKIEFAISNKPEDGDVYGSGKVIIDDVYGI